MSLAKKLPRLLITLALCILIAAAEITPALAAGISYPQGVTNQDASAAVSNTDTFVKNAVPALAGRPLASIVYSTLYSDETLSQILTSVYSGLEDQRSSLQSLGIDVSTSAAAKNLARYTSVAAALARTDSWKNVDLSAARWNVDSKGAFSHAVSAMFAPFYDILYTLLCGGDYKLSLVTIEGDEGYANSVINLLTVLDCGDIESKASFKARADQDKENMLTDIIYSMLSLVDKICASPSNELTYVLPRFAQYVNDGRFEKDVNSLLEPVRLKIGFLETFFTGAVMLKVLLFIQDPSSLTKSFKDNITSMLNGALSDSGIELAEIDFDRLASCASDKGDAYTDIMRWLIETLKKNTSKVSETLKQNEDLSSFADAANSILAKSEEELLAMLIKLFSQTQGKPLEYEWQDPAFTQEGTVYTPNLGKEQFQKALDGIDEVLSEAIAEGGTYKNIKQAVSSYLYSDSTLTMITTSLYGALNGEGISQYIGMILPDATEEGLVSLLYSGGYSSAASELSRSSDWSKIEELDWGIKTGSRKQFQKALTVILSPMIPLLDFLLANGVIEIFGGARLAGSNGYNTAVIPLLEALGCKSSDIVPYDKYVKGLGKKDMVEDLLDPVLDLADRICEKPVNTAVEILPNIMFFIKNGSLMQCLLNLISPLEALLSDLSIDLDSLGVDLEKIKQIDILSEISKSVTSLSEDLKLKQPDLARVAALGEKETIKSLRTYNGSATEYAYIKADGPAVFLTLLRYIVDTIKDPDNSGFITNMLSSSTDGSNDMITQFSSGFTDKFAEMTTDESIEWLYQLFFRERAVEPVTEEYIPTIIYNRTVKKHISAKTAAALVMVAMIAALFIVINRERIVYEISIFFKRQKKAKTIVSGKEGGNK